MIDRSVCCCHCHCFSLFRRLSLSFLVASLLAQVHWVQQEGYSHQLAALMVEKVGGDDTTTTTNNRRHLVAVKRKYESRKYHHISSEFENPVMDHLLD